MQLEPIKIKGNGTSLWCKKEISNKEFTINEIHVRCWDEGWDDCEEGQPYGMQVFGPDTEWFHYTDKGIENEIEQKLLKRLQRMYPNFIITDIGWSEQGMQPDGGWDFDICSKKKV